MLRRGPESKNVLVQLGATDYNQVQRTGMEWRNMGMLD